MGFFSSLGHDISAGFKDVGHFLSNPMHDLEVAGVAAAIALPFLAPEILPAIGGAAGLGGLFGGGEAAAGAGLSGGLADILGLGATDVGAAGSVTAADIAAAGGAGLGDLGVAGLTAPGVGLSALGATSPLDAMAAATATDVAAAGGDLGVAGLTAPGVGLGGAAGTPLDLTAGLGGAAGGDVYAPAIAGAESGTGGGGFLDALGSSIMKNPLQAIGMGVGAAGIGMNLLNMAKGLPYESQLKAQAGQAGAVAGQDLAQQAALTAPLTTGNLPPQWEAAVQTAAQQGRDAIASKYASMGLSNSSSEAGDIAALDARLPEIRMQIAQGMAQIGMSYGNQALAAMGLQDNIYTALMDANIKQDQALAQSIAAFAGAAGRAQAVKSS